MVGVDLHYYCRSCAEKIGLARFQKPKMVRLLFVDSSLAGDKSLQELIEGPFPSTDELILLGFTEETFWDSFGQSRKDRIAEMLPPLPEKKNNEVRISLNSPENFRDPADIINKFHPQDGYPRQTDRSMPSSLRDLYHKGDLKIICKGCGMSVGVDFKFCPNCSNPLII
jgi:hypothetical protein